MGDLRLNDADRAILARITTGDLVDEFQAGLTEMMSTRHPWKVVLTRENGRERSNEACYYASL